MGSRYAVAGRAATAEIRAILHNEAAHRRRVDLTLSPGHW